MPSRVTYIYLSSASTTMVVSGRRQPSRRHWRGSGWGIFKNITTNFVGAWAVGAGTGFRLCSSAIDGLKAQLENLGETKA